MNNLVRTTISTKTARWGEIVSWPPNAVTNSFLQASSSRAARVRRSIAFSPRTFTRAITALRPCLLPVSAIILPLKLGPTWVQNSPQHPLLYGHKRHWEKLEDATL